MGVAYNVIAFPLAAGVFYPFVLNPAIAALSMSGSSALVAVNALLLKRFRLEAPPIASSTRMKRKADETNGRKGARSTERTIWCNMPGGIST